jgi:hypothetical protein
VSLTLKRKSKAAQAPPEHGPFAGLLARFPDGELTEQQALDIIHEHATGSALGPPPTAVGPLVARDRSVYDPATGRAPRDRTYDRASALMVLHQMAYFGLIAGAVVRRWAHDSQAHTGRTDGLQRRAAT